MPTRAEDDLKEIIWLSVSVVSRQQPETVCSSMLATCQAYLSGIGGNRLHML
jgi:hypothetical protein